MHTQPPEVSVIIPAYNVTAYIGDTLESVFRQHFKQFEVIVVNDNCPDTLALETVLTEYQPRISYLKHTVNGGPSAARNTGIAAAKGELLAFLDGDDIWEPDYLTQQIAVLRNSPGADLVYCDALVFGDTRDAGKRLMTLSPSTGTVTLSSLFRQHVQVTVSVLAKREAVCRVGLFDTGVRGTEDFDLWVRLVKEGGNIIYHRRQLWRYRKHAGSLSADDTRMLNAALHVASKTLQRADLTCDEQKAIKDTVVRWTSDLRLSEAKDACSNGHYRLAAVLLNQANSVKRSWRMAFGAFVLCWMPGLRSALWRTYARYRSPRKS